MNVLTTIVRLSTVLVGLAGLCSAFAELLRFLFPFTRVATFFELNFRTKHMNKYGKIIKSISGPLQSKETSTEAN